MSISIDIDTTAAGIIPKGEYLATFADFEHKTFRSGSEAIILEFVTDLGPVKTKLWPYGSEGGARFAQVKLAQMAKAIGMTGKLEGDYDQILAKFKGKRMLIVVSEEPDGGYGPSNDIKAFKPFARQEPTAAVKAAPAPSGEFTDDMPF
jgi:hypothetical protein